MKSQRIQSGRRQGLSIGRRQVASANHPYLPTALTARMVLQKRSQSLEFVSQGGYAGQELSQHVRPLVSFDLGGADTALLGLAQRDARMAEDLQSNQARNGI